MAIGKFANDITPQASTICVRVGKRIRELRQARGWTQQILADHAQIERSHLARLEEGKREAGLMMLEKIAEALETSLSELLKDL
jgi:putative transcriptional regulator